MYLYTVRFMRGSVPVRILGASMAIGKSIPPAPKYLCTIYGYAVVNTSTAVSGNCYHNHGPQQLPVNPIQTLMWHVRLSRYIPL